MPSPAAQPTFPGRRAPQRRSPNRRSRERKHGELERQPGDDPGQRHAGRHVVVDAEHMRPQAGVDRHRPIAAEATHSRVAMWCPIFP